jgi:hypothetical protein
MNIKLPPYLKGKKASDAFMEYVEPFLEYLLLDRVEHCIIETPSIAEFERVLRVPWGIWNAIVAEKDPNNSIDCIAWMGRLTSHLPESTKKLFNFMIKRKRNNFSQYQYYLTKYYFYYDQNNELRFRIESCEPSTVKNFNVTSIFKYYK